MDSKHDLYAVNGVRFSQSEIYTLLRLKCQKWKAFTLIKRLPLNIRLPNRKIRVSLNNNHLQHTVLNILSDVIREPPLFSHSLKACLPLIKRRHWHKGTVSYYPLVRLNFKFTVHKTIICIHELSNVIYYVTSPFRSLPWLCTCLINDILSPQYSFEEPISSPNNRSLSGQAILVYKQNWPYLSVIEIT